MGLRVAVLAAVAGLAAASFTEALAKNYAAQDVVGQSAGGSKGVLMWRFQQQEPRAIKVLEENYNGDTAAPLVNVTTEGGRSSRSRR